MTLHGLQIIIDFSLSETKRTKIESPIFQNTSTIWPGSNLTVHQDTDWFGTLCLRTGVTPDPKLPLYAIGGLAYGDVSYSSNADFNPAGARQHPVSFSKTETVRTAGADAEYAINSKWECEGRVSVLRPGHRVRHCQPGSC